MGLKAFDAAVEDARQQKAREQWEAGEATELIAKTAGVTTTSIYNWAKAGKWKRPEKRTPPAQGGSELGGRVRCPHCQLHTEKDPCEACGKPVRKKF